MKRYIFGIDEYQAKWAFSPIRNRRDIVSLLMKTVKVMLINTPVDETIRAGTIVLIVSKMSRLFYVSEAKVFSISFPLFVQEIEDSLIFKSHGHPDVNSKVSSDILALLESDGIFDTPEVLSFAEPISDACAYDLDLWALFRDLLIAEDGYIRYDYDEVREDGHRHPLNHLDIFYSTSATFKLGLNEKLDHENFANILDLNTDCHYVSPATR